MRVHADDDDDDEWDFRKRGVRREDSFGVGREEAPKNSFRMGFGGLRRIV